MHPNEEQIDQAVAEIAAKKKNENKEPEVKPFRVQLNFMGAHMDEDVIWEKMEAITDFGESLGLIFSFGGMQAMPLEDVVPDSRLDQIVHGKPPRIR